MKTVLDTIRTGTPWLEKAGVENARLNMELLLAKVLGCRRMQLYMDFDRPLSETELAPLRDLVKRRREGEPLQHLLGSVEFMGREFHCDRRALIPRPETEELVEKILARYRLPDATAPLTILDMGCGSGVIGLSLAAAFPQAHVTLADISPDALALARENAALLGLPQERIIFVESNLWSALGSSTFDLVAANLPYIDPEEISQLSTEVRHDPLLALDGGTAGTALIRQFLHDLPQHLNADGQVALEVGTGQTTEFASQLTALGIPHAEICHDLARHDRFVFAGGRDSA